MGKKCILTPTYVGHFDCIKVYLKSFDRWVMDKNDIPIFFIVSRNELEKFKSIINDYCHLNINVICFEDILIKFGIEESCEYLLSKYGRYSFQSMKKLYGMLYLQEYRYFCVLDSESIWIKKTNMNRLIDDFNNNKFITYSNPDERLVSNSWCKQFTENINYVLNDSCNYWFIEQFFRYWDSNILREIVTNYGSVYDIVKKIYKFEDDNSKKHLGLFESVLYDQYVFNNLHKFNYKAIDMGKKLKFYLGNLYEKYEEEYDRCFGGGCGISEHVLKFINSSNENAIISLYNDLHFNLIRIEETNYSNYKSQVRFISQVKPNMLVCSQNNILSENYRRTFIKHNKYYDRIKSESRMWGVLVRNIFSLIFYPLLITINLFRWYYKVIKTKRDLKYIEKYM